MAPRRGFLNATRWPALAVPTLDPAGREVLVAVVKATYEVGPGGRVVPAAGQAPIRIDDELREGDDPERSIRLPTDVCVRKVGTDVVIVGDAVSPRPAAALDVALHVRERTVVLRVHGPRVFGRTLGDVVVGPAAPFERAPLVYELAYGGHTADYSVAETRNLAGVGVARRAADLVDQPAPRIEDPARPHGRAADAHPPCGFGAIRSHWSPRRERSGTLDTAWQRGRMPLLPLDYDDRFANVAHPKLQFEPPLRPGDAVGVLGMRAEGPLAFELPSPGVVIRAWFDVSPRQEVRPPIDTLLVEPGARRFELTLRAAFPRGRGRDVLREVCVDLDD